MESYILTLLGLPRMPRPPREDRENVPEYVKYLYQELNSEDLPVVKGHSQEQREPPAKIMAVGAMSSKLALLYHINKSKSV